MTLDEVSSKNVPAQVPLPSMPPLVPTIWESTNPTTRIMAMVLRCELPENPKDYHQFFELMLNVAGTNPNCTKATIDEWVRDMIDIDDRAFSEGMTHVMMAKARKLLFKMRAYMSRGDNEHRGLSGVSSIITVRQQAEQTVKVPQQQPAPGLFGFNFLRKKGGD